MGSNHIRRRGRRPLLLALAGCLSGGSLLAPAVATAQSAPAAPVAEELEELDAIDLAPSSLEQGQTRMQDSFGPSREEWIRDTRRKACTSSSPRR